MVKELVRVMDLGYEEDGGEPIVWVATRTADGERKHVEIEGTRPYAFVPKGEEVPNESYVLSVDEEAPDGTPYEGYDGLPLQKVTVKLPSHINTRKNKPCLADHIPKEFLYEGDIPYVRRVSVDYGLSGYIRVPKGDRIHISDVETNIDPSSVENIAPRVMMADIETTKPDLSGSREWDDFVEDANQPITAITTYDSYSGEYAAIVLDEEGKVNPGEIRGYLEEHWDDHELADRFVNADMRLVQCDDEKSLLQAFVQEVEDNRPDIMSGWNWLDFDHQYIINRLKRDEFSDLTEHRLSDVGVVGGYKTAQMIDGLPGFDMMGAYCEKMTFSNWRSKSLDYVTNETLGVGKVEDMNIDEEYESNRSRFLAYNIIDTQLLVAMEDRNGIHEFFYQLADLSSVQVYDTFSEMRLVDGFVMGRRDATEILPASKEKDLGSIAGGLVLTPSQGVNEWVGVLDLKSLYPSVFITLNISEETLTKKAEVEPKLEIGGDDGEVETVVLEQRNEDGADFRCPAMPESESDVGGEITEDHISWNFDDDVAMGTQTDEEGILPKYLKLLFTERSKFKAKRDGFSPEDPEYDVYDNKQAAIKVVMNSFYGVSQNDYYRLSTPVRGDDGIGSTITAGGRYVLWRGAQIMEEMGYTVKYGDTDSVMIQLADKSEDVTPREVYERGMEVEAKLNERMDEVADEFGIGDEHPFLKDADLHGNDRHCLHWEFEKLYRRFLQAGTKKRYAGLPVWKEGKWYIDDPDAHGSEIQEVEPDITGFESNRADVLPIAAKTQKKVIERVLAGDGFESLSGYLSGVVEDIKDLNVPLHEIAKPGVLNKSLDEYGNTPTARACRYSNRELDMEWREGDDPWVYYIRTTPPMVQDTDVLALEWGQELPEGFEINKSKVLDKVKAPLEPVLGETEWTFDELQTGRKMQGVETESQGNPFSDGSPIPITNDTDESNTTEEAPGEQQRPKRRGDEVEDDASDGEGEGETSDALSW